MFCLTVFNFRAHKVMFMQIIDHRAEKDVLEYHLSRAKREVVLLVKN